MYAHTKISSSDIFLIIILSFQDACSESKNEDTGYKIDNQKILLPSYQQYCKEKV